MSKQDTFIQVRDFVSKNSWFQFEEETETELHFATREHGDVGLEDAHPKDIDAAREICKRLHHLHSNIKATYETCDEWVNITVEYVIPSGEPNEDTDP